MKPSTFERTFTCLWHVGLAFVGLYERKHHKTQAGKILGTGMALWHFDAAIADALGTECLLKRGLRKLSGIEA